jgi:soluble lytic murein transglycosylase-like protein
VAVPPRRLLAGATASVLVLGLAVAISDAGTATAISSPMAKVAPRLLPRDYDSYVRAASVCPGLDPLVLVAIHDVESGRDAQGETSGAGAVGPMQFLPETWAHYGIDANHDGVADPMNLTDALMGATQLLCANGVTADATHESAIWNYNHSRRYVNAVLARAAELHQALGV